MKAYEKGGNLSQRHPKKPLTDRHHILEVYIEYFFLRRQDFQILHSPIWRRFTHSGSDAVYLSTV